MKQTNIKDFVEVQGLSLPIMKVPRVESITYALRLTPLGKYGVKEIEEFFKDTFCDYIFVREESKKAKEHYHAVLFDYTDEDSVREKIRLFLRKYFTEPPKRGDANKQYNLSQIEDIELAIIYILKDSTEIFYSDNIIEESVKQLSKKSYKKYSKEEFSKQLEELKKQFKEQDTRLDDMMVKIYQLKALYRQPINPNYIYQMCLSFQIHNDPNRASAFVRNFLSRLE